MKKKRRKITIGVTIIFIMYYQTDLLCSYSRKMHVVVNFKIEIIYASLFFSSSNVMVHVFDRVWTGGLTHNPFEI